MVLFSASQADESKLNSGGVVPKNSFTDYHDDGSKRIQRWSASGPDGLNSSISIKIFQYDTPYVMLSA